MFIWKIFVTLHMKIYKFANPSRKNSRIWEDIDDHYRMKKVKNATMQRTNCSNKSKRHAIVKSLWVRVNFRKKMSTLWVWRKSDSPRSKMMMISQTRKMLCLFTCLFFTSMGKFYNFKESALGRKQRHAPADLLRTEGERKNGKSENVRVSGAGGYKNLSDPPRARAPQLQQSLEMEIE